MRNLSFDVDDDTLYEFFSRFGPVEFAKVVIDPLTQHSRGTGFVKFKDAEDASAVFSESQLLENAPTYTLDNRILCISMAVSRADAAKLRTRHSDTEETEVLDNNPQSLASILKRKGRNLHLAQIGLIRPGTPAAEGLSKEDLVKREALFEARKAKLKNPNFYVNDLRICVQNLPLNITDSDLRQLCFKFVKDRKNCRITECRIMRNMTPGRQQNRSLGYAFVSFQNHHDALKVLNEMNNNPNLFPNSRRPIVEFVLENMKALEVKQRRMERCVLIQSKRQSYSDTKNSRPTSPNKPVTSKPRPKLHKSTSIKIRTKTKSKLNNFPKRFGSKQRHRDRSNSKTMKQIQSRKKKFPSKLSRQQKRAKRPKLS